MKHFILIAALAAVALPAQSRPQRDCPKGYIQDRDPPFKCVRGTRSGPMPEQPDQMLDVEALEQEIERAIERRERKLRR